ncbi:hypothetical protein L1987_45473 [Smallanthus sonchifolius]|uniref:Uncharacterized protein n=1 Tax=Smallanthus sonchifolius TaxID=185202 RepID=A0ACB9FYR5_9ASTR|nr:hypothetical protein L1987_45473 [Smallanthus sonchifolius]
MPELRRPEEEVVVNKNTYIAFRGTSLEERLKEMGVAGGDRDGGDGGYGRRSVFTLIKIELGKRMPMKLGLGLMEKTTIGGDDGVA